MALHITEKKVGPVIVVELTGRITLGDESTQLRNKLKTLLAGKPRLVLDMANVDYIDSAGLGTLVATFTSAANQGVRMVLANLTKRLRDQLSITKLVTVFETFDSVDEAVKSSSKA
jgi:anti-sigma B factor antagonist